MKVLVTGAAGFIGYHVARRLAESRRCEVVGIDNLRLARIARLSGAPQVPGAGVDLRVKLGQAVKAGDPLYRLHARFEADFSFACRMAQQDSGYRLGSADQVPREFASETF